MSVTMKTIALAALAGLSSAHMIMLSPTPFANSIGGFGVDDPDNSPLNEDGSNYPCHMVGGYDADFSNEMALGSTQDLTFRGTAVHGGGSCQVSITYDESPTKRSVFKVIYSIEGGCPAKNQAGNISPANRLTDAPDAYSFTLPDNIPTGKAVLAWTWFNRIGNREMYMNCAPITITGSGGDVANFNALPDMMVANIGEKKCTVAEGTDVAFPNPGNSVEQFSFDGSYQDVSSQEACSYNWMAGDGPGSIGAPAGGDSDSISGSAPSATSAAPTTTAEPVPTIGLPGNVFITVTTNDSTASPTAAPAPTTTTEVISQPTTTVPSADREDSTGDESGSDSGSGSTCTDGQFQCNTDGNTFNICDHGVWGPAMAVAPGTTCSPGVDITLNISKLKKSKRAQRARRAKAFRS